MEQEYYVRKLYGQPETVICKLEALTNRGTLASALVERWGMVAGKPDGEDSAGRQRLALLTVDELVTRACETSEKLFAEIDRRGWLTKLPRLDEAAALLNDQKD